MTEHQMTLLVPPAARSAHAELLAALGTESNPSQWMDFMDAVTRLLPDVLSSGRPTKESIQRCAIGQLGFTSWQAMIEAPTDTNGLGWNFSAWKAWRRAWSTVEAHPWLRQEAMTSSEVNTLAQDCKRNDEPFPSSADELEALKKGRKSAQDAKRTESVQALTQRAEVAEKAAQEATAALAVVRQQLDAALVKIEEQAQAIGALKTEKATAEEGRDLWKKKAQAPKPTEPALTRWQHFAAFVLGR